MDNQRDNILSAEEVGALFAAVRDSGVPDGPGDDSGCELTPFSPRVLDAATGDFERLVERVHEVLTVETSASLAALTRLPASLAVSDAVLRKVGELALGGNEAAIELKLAGGALWLTMLMPEDVVRALADRMLGGPGHSGATKRPLSELERRVAARPLEGLGDAIAKAWRPWVHGQIEVGLSFSPRLGPSERALHVCPATIVIGDVRAEGALAYHLEAARGVTRDKGAPEPAAAGRTLAARLPELPLKIAVRSEGFVLTVRELLGLSMGQALALGPSGDLQVDVLVEGRRRFRGKLNGAKQGRRVQIVDAAN